MMSIDEEKKIKEIQIKDLVNKMDEILISNEDVICNSIRKVFKSVSLNVIQHFSDKNKDFGSNEIDNDISQYLSQYIKRTPLDSHYMTFGLIE